MIMKIKIKFIILKDFVLKFLSVYCFFFIGDIFVGVIKDNLRVGIVMYYNWYGEKMKDIQYNNNGKLFYSKFVYIMENSNGDIVVFDVGFDNVVVMDRRGNYCFLYIIYCLCLYR